MEPLIKLVRINAEKTVAIFHEVRRNSHSIAPIFVKNIGSFSKLKIIGLDQRFLIQLNYLFITKIEYASHGHG